MEIVANSLNGVWTRELVNWADSDDLVGIDLAVAYTSRLDELLKLSSKRGVSLNLYTLANGEGFPSVDVAKKMVGSSNSAWRLYLIRNYYHPKIMWFRGVGAYIGSANLSDSAWSRNQECGIWMTEAELSRENWIEQLRGIFSTVRGACKEATLEDIEALESIKKRRVGLNKLQAEFEQDVKKLLSGIPGDRPLTDVTKTKARGGAAREAFLQEWELGLTTLRKLAKRFDQERQRWPAWVDQSAEPSIVQDQATEAWWHHQFRLTRESSRLMEGAHAKNRTRLLEAEEELIDFWQQFDPDDVSRWQVWVNESPRFLYETLTEQSLVALDLETLEEALSRCHAAIAHSRQIRNVDYGIEADAHTDLATRVRLFAEYLWKARSSAGRTISEVLLYVLWGDKTGGPEDQNPAARIWTALHYQEWKLPHLGAHILGELIGYARPQEYPPRNNRVSKTLHALGYEGIRYS